MPCVQTLKTCRSSRSSRSSLFPGASTEPVRLPEKYPVNTAKRSQLCRSPIEETAGTLAGVGPPFRESIVFIAKRRSSLSISRRLAMQGMLALGGIALVGCSTGTRQSSQTDDDWLLAWPAEDRWPEIFSEAPRSVQDAYRFAVANEDLLKWMPCFCGCVDLGHASNYDCYVQEARDDGSVLLDSMSFG